MTTESIFCYTCSLDEKQNSIATYLPKGRILYAKFLHMGIHAKFCTILHKLLELLVRYAYSNHPLTVWVHININHDKMRMRATLRTPHSSVLLLAKIMVLHICKHKHNKN